MKKSVLSLMLATLFLICGCGASLIFVSDWDGRDQIYSMAGNGFNQHNLSNSSSNEHFPDLSPDATKIAFSSFRNPPGENIYIMDLDGLNVRQVTSGTGQRTRPRWAPNGLIAFTYPAHTQGARIWTIRSDIHEASPVLGMAGVPLHKCRVAVRTCVSAAYVWIDAVISSGDARFRKNGLHLHFIDCQP